MLKEIESLWRGKAWQSAELPKGKKVKGCRWVYRKKESSKKAVWSMRLVESMVLCLNQVLCSSSRGA